MIIKETKGIKREWFELKEWQKGEHHRVYLNNVSNPKRVKTLGYYDINKEKFVTNDNDLNITIADDKITIGYNNNSWNMRNGFGWEIVIEGKVEKKEEDKKCLFELVEEGNGFVREF